MIKAPRKPRYFSSQSQRFIMYRLTDMGFAQHEILAFNICEISKGALSNILKTREPAIPSRQDLGPGKVPDPMLKSTHEAIKSAATERFNEDTRKHSEAYLALMDVLPTIPTYEARAAAAPSAVEEPAQPELPPTIEPVAAVTTKPPAVHEVDDPWAETPSVAVSLARQVLVLERLVDLVERRTLSRDEWDERLDRAVEVAIVRRFLPPR